MTTTFTTDLNQAVYQISKLCLEQGSHQGLSELAFSLSSRFYYAISMCPPSWLGKLSEEGQRDSENDTMLRSIELGSKLCYLLPHSITEPDLSQIIRDLCCAIAESNASIHLLLDRLNHRLLEPLKSRLNPRKLGDFEEAFSKIFYPYLLSQRIKKEVSYLPKNAWPNISGYRIIHSYPKKGVVYPFLAERMKDGLKCLIEMAQHAVFMPRLDKKDWPNALIDILEEGEYQGLRWIVTPFASSFYLNDILPLLNEQTTLLLGEHILEILAALHHRNHGYLDISPERFAIVIHHRLQLKLVPYEQRTTFRSLIAQRDPLPALSAYTDRIYASPEQRKGEKGDVRADIWGFGCLLYECFEGKHPFYVKTWGELSLQKFQDIQQLESQQIPQLLIGMIKQCLSTQPNDRFVGAHELLELYRPLIKQIKDAQRMAVRKDFWESLIRKQRLLSFIRAFNRVEKDGEFLLNDFENAIATHDLILPPEEDSQLLIQLLLALVEQKKVFRDELINWQSLLNQAQDAKIKLIEKIERNSSVQIFERLEDLANEKKYLKEKIENSQNKVLFFQRNDLKIFYEMLSQYLSTQGLQLSIKESQPEQAVIKEIQGFQQPLPMNPNENHYHSQVNFFKLLHQILDEQDRDLPISHIPQVPHLSKNPNAVKSPTAILSSPIKTESKAPQRANTQSLQPKQVNPQLIAYGSQQAQSQPPKQANTQPIANGSQQAQSQPPKQAVSGIPVSSDPYKQALPPPFPSSSQSPSTPPNIPPSIPSTNQQITKSVYPSQPLELLSRVSTIGSSSVNDQDIDIVDQLFAAEQSIAHSSPQGQSNHIKPQPVEATIPAKSIAPEQSKANTASIPIVIPPVKSMLQRAGQAVPQAYIAPRSDQKTERISTPPPTIQAETMLDQELEELKQLKELFERFLELRKECGEAEISFEIFSEQIHTARNQYIANHGWTPLKFNVYLKNNKVALKAKPIKL